MLVYIRLYDAVYIISSCMIPYIWHSLWHSHTAPFHTHIIRATLQSGNRLGDPQAALSLLVVFCPRALWLVTLLRKITCKLRHPMGLCSLHTSTGWQRPIGGLNLQVFSRKNVTNCRALLQKTTYTDKACCGSLPHCTTLWHLVHDTLIYGPLYLTPSLTYTTCPHTRIITATFELGNVLGFGSPHTWMTPCIWYLHI